MVATAQRKWLALGSLSAVQFMVVLDIAIVNVALPSIKVDLGFSQENLQWVISAYALVFGGFLLLGGRAADLLGRRRIFLVGAVVFTVGSLLAGLAWSEASLIAAPCVPGPRRGDHLAGRALDPHDDVRRRAVSGTSRSASGAPSAASAPRRACCSAASSPTRSAGSGSSSSTSRSARRPRAHAVALHESRDARVRSFDVPGAVIVTGGLSLARLRDHAGERDGWRRRRDRRRFAAARAARRLRRLGAAATRSR